MKAEKFKFNTGDIEKEIGKYETKEECFPVGSEIRKMQISALSNLFSEEKDLTRFNHVVTEWNGRCVRIIYKKERSK